jgi:hypothetical protein
VIALQAAELLYGEMLAARSLPTLTIENADYNVIR